VSFGDLLIPALLLPSNDQADNQAVQHSLFGDIGQTQRSSHAQKYNTGGRLFIFIWRLLRVFRAYFSLLESVPVLFLDVSHVLRAASQSPFYAHFG
jgi:hypothetical protein